jgi:hypothetical protein
MLKLDKKLVAILACTVLFFYVFKNINCRYHRLENAIIIGLLCNSITILATSNHARLLLDDLRGCSISSLLLLECNSHLGSNVVSSNVDTI